MYKRQGEEEPVKLLERLDKASTAYGMEISVEETKPMTNYTSGIKTEIKVNEQKAPDITDGVPSLRYSPG